MKVLDAATLHEGIDQTLREIKDIQSKLSEIQRSVQGIISLEDDLKGKTGEGIRSFYRTIHEPFLIFLYQSLIDYSLVLESVREAVQSYEPDGNGLVRQDFIESDVVRGLNRLEDTAADLIGQVNREISGISDLVALPRLDIGEFSYVAQIGRKRLTETVGQLSQLDDSQTRKLVGVEKDQGVMKQYMREMSRTFSHNGHMIPSFSLSTVLNLPTFPTIWKSIYGDSATEKEEKKEDNFLVKGLKVTGNSIKGAGLGLFDFGKDTVVEVYETVKDPAGAVESLVYAAKHPVETYQYIEKSIVDSYERDMINGNAESRAHWVTYALGTTATAVVGTKGTGALTKSGIATTRAGTVRVIDSAKNLDLAALFPYSSKYQLSLADNVPYNVVNGNTLKENLLMKVEGKGKDTGKVLDDGTVWENIKITQPLYEGTKIPKSFELVADGKKFWVHPNGTKHMVEYITRDATTHGMPINSQTLLSSFQNTVKNAVKEGIKYEEIMNIGNWELIFSKPRGDGLLPVIKHAVYMP